MSRGRHRFQRTHTERIASIPYRTRPATSSVALECQSVPFHTVNDRAAPSSSQPSAPESHGSYATARAAVEQLRGLEQQNFHTPGQSQSLQIHRRSTQPAPRLRRSTRLTRQPSQAIDDNIRPSTMQSRGSAPTGGQQCLQRVTRSVAEEPNLAYDLNSMIRDLVSDSKPRECPMTKLMQSSQRPNFHRGQGKGVPAFQPRTTITSRGKLNLGRPPKHTSSVPASPVRVPGVPLRMKQLVDVMDMEAAKEECPKLAKINQEERIIPAHVKVDWTDGSVGISTDSLARVTQSKPGTPVSNQRKPRPPKRLVLATRAQTAPIISEEEPAPEPAVEPEPTPEPAPVPVVQTPERSKWLCACGNPHEAQLLDTVLHSRPNWQMQRHLDAVADVLARSPAHLLWVPNSQSIWWTEMRASSCLGSGPAKQLLNVFEADKQFCQLDLLWTNIQNFCDERILMTQKYMPDTLCLNTTADLEALGTEGAWVLRSSEDAYQKVDCICNTTKQVSSKLLATRDSGVSWMAQRYVEQTVTWKGRKIDLRCYCLIDTLLDAWLFKRCFCVAATKPCENRTAYNNREARCPSASAEGAEGFNIEQLEVELVKLGIVARHVVPQMFEVVADTVSAIRPKLAESLCGEANCFEFANLLYQIHVQVFEFRFVLSEVNFGVQLVSIQSEDILHTRTAAHASIVPALLENIFQGVVDPIFPPVGSEPPRPTTSATSKGDLIKLVLRGSNTYPPFGFLGGL